MNLLYRGKEGLEMLPALSDRHEKSWVSRTYLKQKENYNSTRMFTGVIVSFEEYNDPLSKLNARIADRSDNDW